MAQAFCGVIGPLILSFNCVSEGTTLYAVTSVVFPTSMVLLDAPRLPVGVGVAVGGIGVAVGGIGVAVGGIGVAVGGIGVAVGGIGVAVGGIGVAVGGRHWSAVGGAHGVGVGGGGTGVGVAVGQSHIGGQRG